MNKKISLIIVEYPGGKIAVQPCFEGDELFRNCEKCTSDAINSRMTHVELEYGKEDITSVIAKAKILRKTF